MGCHHSKDAQSLDSTDSAGSSDNGKASLLSATPDKAGSTSEQATTPPTKDKATRRKSVVTKAPETNVASKVEAPYDKAIIGTLTKHGIAPAPRGPGGSKAKINQDRGMVCWPFNGTHNQALLCVFDGHGMQGERISEWCTQQLPERLERDRDTLLSDTPAALSKAIIEMDQTLLSSPQLGVVARGAGTTSNVLYFHGSKLWTACSGDSRAVLGRWPAGGKAAGVVAVDLSRDHKPDLPEEQARIERAGGVVSKAGPTGLPPSRVWVNGRVGLAMSRSIGDGEAKGHGVIPDPEIKERVLDPAKDSESEGDAFVIVASDGIWEFISSQQACEMVHAAGNASKACEALVAQAEKRWQEEEGSYRDDITCIVAFLPFLEQRDDEDYTAPLGKATGGVEDEAFLVSADAGPTPLKATPPGDDNDKDARVSTGGEEFVKRRLSVAAGMFDNADDELKA